MFTIIGGDGKEYGPVSTEQIRAWLAAGRANLDTKAKAVGTEEWRRLGDFADFVGGSAPASAPRTSAPPPAPVGDVSAKEFAADLIARAAPLDIGACLGSSFELWKSNFLPLVGVTLLVIIVQCVANMIPVLGIFSALLLNGVFYGGVYYYYLGKIRGEHRDVGDAFAGFTRSFGSLLVASLITSLVSFALMLVFCAPLVMFFVRTLMHSGQPITGLPAFGPLGLIGILAGFVVIIYISVAWAFTFALIVDRGLRPWTAMEVSRRVISKQWFRVFCVLFVGALLTMLGVIALFVGVFLTLPLMFGAVMYAYEALCNPPPRT